MRKAASFAFYDPHRLDVFMKEFCEQLRQFCALYSPRVLIICPRGASEQIVKSMTEDDQQWASYVPIKYLPNPTTNSIQKVWKFGGELLLLRLPFQCMIEDFQQPSVLLCIDSISNFEDKTNNDKKHLSSVPAIIRNFAIQKGFTELIFFEPYNSKITANEKEHINDENEMPTFLKDDYWKLFSPAENQKKNIPFTCNFFCMAQ
eukprot:GHVP01052550.1.p1 GENE.GHVP01052550.1~~GHVP01052550.1.p1  ORF type:complete len:204 (-),score=34.95 GHVP01052550.1:1650-2261(-)